MHPCRRIASLVVGAALLAACGTPPAATSPAQPGTTTASSNSSAPAETTAQHSATAAGAVPATQTASAGTALPAIATPTSIPRTSMPVAATAPAVTAGGPATTSDLLIGELIVGDTAKYRLAMRCRGQGSPTVVLDDGVRGISGAWVRTQMPHKVATFTRVCTYDRFAVGPRFQGPLLTAEGLAHDLHALLESLDVDAPYVLVAASFAGFKARLFAHHYPDEVAGMVFLDVAHEDVNSRALRLLPPEAPGENKALAELRKEWSDPTWAEEHVDWKASEEQVRAVAGPLGDMPLIVLSAGVQEWPPDFPKDLAERIDQDFIQLHADLARLSSNGTHRIVENSGHNIEEDQPEVVFDAISEVVEAVRSR